MQPDLELVQVSRDQSFKAWSHGYPFRTVRWHFHPEYELHLVTHTTGTFMVGDHVGSFAPGHLVLVGPNLPHNWISRVDPGETVPERGLVLQFTGESLAAATAAFPEMAALDRLLVEARRGIEFGPGGSDLEFYAEIRVLMVALIEADGLKRIVLFLDLLDRLARHPARRPLVGPAYRPDPDGYMTSAVNHVISHVGAHFAQDLSEAELARLCGRSPSAFSRLFRKHTGMGFVRYVNRLRIDAACRLLMSTDKSVTDICFEVGFNNLSNFNRQFLAYKGLPPSRFRAFHLTVIRPTTAGPAPLPPSALLQEDGRLSPPRASA